MRVKFTDLEPKWVKYATDGEYWTENGEDGAVITPNMADGVLFLHPREFLENNGKIGTCCILLWFRGKVPDHVKPGPGRWTLVNGDFEQFEVSPSIDLTQDHGSGPRPDEWHGWIQKGYVT